MIHDFMYHHNQPGNYHNSSIFDAACTASLAPHLWEILAASVRFAGAAKMQPSYASWTVRWCVSPPHCCGSSRTTSRPLRPCCPSLMGSRGGDSLMTHWMPIHNLSEGDRKTAFVKFCQDVSEYLGIGDHVTSCYDLRHETLPRGHHSKCIFVVTEAGLQLRTFLFPDLVGGFKHFDFPQHVRWLVD